MFWLIKQGCIALLSFSGSLAAKCVSLNNKSSMNRPTLIDLNPAKLNYYPLVFSLDKCNWSCNAVDDLFTKICVDDLSTKIYQVKTLLKHNFMWL